uniref:Gamma-tubulin complex component n=1 Tax=Echinostoma caproni TaxID=27848 RepID=A0A183AXI3_9TREM
LANPYGHLIGCKNSVANAQLNSDTTIDLNRIPIQVLLNRVVLCPLLAYFREVDRAVCNHFLYELHLMDHFHCLRQLYFLEHGEFSQSLLDELFAKADGPLSRRSDVYNSGFLRDLMQSVLRKFTRQVHNKSSDSDEDFTLNHMWEDHSRTCFSIVCPIDFLAVSGTNVDEDSVVDPRRAPAFDHLSVRYLAPWPINIILHQTVLRKYNRVFCQLVRVRFAIWSLNSCYHQLRGRRVLGSTPNDPRRPALPVGQSDFQFHQTSVWLHEMNQVVRGIETYLVNQAVKASWSKFVKRLTGSNPENFELSSQNTVVTNLDQLIQVHEAYVEEVVRGCLLDPSNEEIQQVICGLLSCVHWFYKVLSTSSWLDRASPTTGQLNQVGWTQLQAAHASFVQHARFLRRRAGRMLSTSRADSNQSCLSQLILALGINDFYVHTTQMSNLKSIETSCLSG